MKPCKQCGKPSQEAHAPFCSSRCRDVDLGRWFSESYRVPAEELDMLDEDSAEQGITPES